MSNPDPHILILCLDTVRKDFYDEYAPRLRNRATIQFDEMRAASAWSVPSHAAMVTGNLPSDTGVHAYHRHFDRLSVNDTWLTDDPIADYNTHAISANVYASPAFGFDTLFDETTVVSPKSWFPSGLDIDAYIQSRPDEAGISHFIRTALTHDYPVQSLANGAIVKGLNLADQLPIRRPVDYGGARISKEIETTFETANDSTFVFANLMDAHGPHTPFRGLNANLYDCPTDWDSSSFSDWEASTADNLEDFEKDIKRVRNLYAAEIDYLDRLLTDLLDRLDEKLDRNLIAIVTADHGENLGYEADKQLLNHTSSLTEGLLHVPFDVVVSGSEQTVSDYTSLLDLGTIVKNIVSGRSATVGLDAPVAAEIAGSGTGLPDGEDAEYWDQARRAVYNQNRKRKYVRSERSETVYDVSGPPSVQSRVNESIPDNAFGVFSTTLAEFAAEAETDELKDEKSLNDGVEARLEDLGYV